MKQIYYNHYLLFLFAYIFILIWNIYFYDTTISKLGLILYIVYVANINIRYGILFTVITILFYTFYNNIRKNKTNGNENNGQTKEGMSITFSSDLISSDVVIKYDEPKNKTKIPKNKTKIPKNIFQTWHTKRLPPRMKECVEKLKKDNPDFNHYLYDDDDCRKFIKEEFDEDVLKAYDSLIPGAFKADLWRYCILYIYGGVYLDIKYQCVNGFTLNDFINDEIPLVREPDNISLYQGILVSEPKNIILYKCIQQIVKNVKNKYYGNTHTDITGPVLLGTFYKNDEIFNKIQYLYKEYDGIGTISNINNPNKFLLQHYNEYRNEQKKYNKKPYYKILWEERRVFLE